MIAWWQSLAGHVAPVGLFPGCEEGYFLIVIFYLVFIWGADMAQFPPL